MKYKTKSLFKTIIILLEISAFAVLAYLIISPFYPNIKYKITYDNPEIIADAKNEEKVREKTAEIINSLPESEYLISPNRLIITKIGVNAPIVESNNEQYGLSRGAWHVPESSTPDKGGNTVITGHRFKYLPPNNVTFYLFDKLEAGDLISVIWQEKNYLYKIKETKIVPNTDLSVLNQTDESILTMFTCHPIYSTENRLVIVASLVD